MSETTLQLDRKEYQAGEILHGIITIDPVHGPVEFVEVVVYWCTEGKGDTDRAEVYRRSFGGPIRNAPNDVGRVEFAVQLPEAPLSYDGVIVKILWFVEARIRICRDDIPGLLKILERFLVPVRRTASFRLGAVKRPQELST
jgi:hypothetical protein